MTILQSEAVIKQQKKKDRAKIVLKIGDQSPY